MTATNDFKNRVRTGWQQVLQGVLSRARDLGPKAVLAFDLDSTLFDNLPRQARILREYGQVHQIAALADCAPHHFTGGWDLRAPLKNVGLTAEQAEALYPDLKAYWAERFFTSEYCVDDVAIEGAAAFTHKVVATGAKLAYVTGRQESMREGSVECMRREGLALPDGKNVVLIMKPTLEEDDDAFKRVAHARLRELGEVIAAFDNEPTHVNDYRRVFPEAMSIHLATDHSGRPVVPLEDIVSVPHFGI